ncbi:MAG: murein hydrolase activator EnvC family protein [Actinomycetota bacterium]
MGRFGHGMARRALFVALLFALTAAALPAAADPQDRLDNIRQRQQQIEQKLGRLDDQSNELLGRIGVLDEKRAQTEDTVEALTARLEKLRLRIATVESELASAQRRISLLTRELQDILGDLDARTDTYSERAVAIYKAGPTAYVDSLLTSEDFGELYDKYEYYQSASDADSALISEIEILREETETRRELVEEEEARIAKAKLALERDKAEVAALHEQQSVILAAREQAVGEKESLLAKVESKKSAYEAVQEQLERDEAQITALLASNSSSGPFPSGGGQLAWPAAGPVTSSYGYRTHPIFGDTRLHTGIDIGAPYGAPVVAAGGGEVVYAGVMSGYGNVIAIDHGGGLATTYNHLSAFYVGSGQRISRGTQIGAVGCTGYCTGAHLHFEVRVNGSPVDPMPYLR